MKTLRRLAGACLAGLLVGCAAAPAGRAGGERLVGAWRSHVQFESGTFSPVKDLEFLYVFNLGGTLTESSNYDAAPPVAPAYGEWRAVGPNRFEARYTFFTTNPPARLDELSSGGGWPPAGRGVVTERISLSEDGRSFDSVLTYEAFDAAGKPVAGGGRALGHGARIGL